MKWRLILPCLVLVAGLTPTAQAQKIKHKPRWQFDLRKLGYRTPGSSLFGLNDPGSNAVVVFSKERVVVAFDAWNRPARDALPQGFFVRLVVFDAVSGHVLTQEEWPSTFPRPEMAATDEGNLVLLMEEKRPPSETWPAELMLLSPELRILHQMSLPSEDENDFWEISVSPTGSSLLLSHHTSSSVSHELFNPDTMALRTSWTDDLNVWGISDNYAMSFGSRTHSVVTCPFNGQWDPIQNLGRWMAIALDSSTLVGVGKTKASFDVVTVGGKKLFGSTLSARRADVAVQPVGASADGRRFILRVLTNAMHWYQASRQFVYVYQSPNSAPIFMLEVHKINSFRLVPVLSPDGSLLAVVYGGELRVFELPAQ